LISIPAAKGFLSKATVDTSSSSSDDNKKGGKKCPIPAGQGLMGDPCDPSAGPSGVAANVSVHNSSPGSSINLQVGSVGSSVPADEVFSPPIIQQPALVIPPPAPDPPVAPDGYCRPRRPCPKGEQCTDEDPCHCGACSSTTSGTSTTTTSSTSDSSHAGPAPKRRRVKSPSKSPDIGDAAERRPSSPEEGEIIDDEMDGDAHVKPNQGES